MNCIFCNARLFQVFDQALQCHYQCTLIHPDLINYNIELKQPYHIIVVYGSYERNYTRIYKRPKLFLLQDTMNNVETPIYSSTFIPYDKNLKNQINRVLSLESFI